MRGITGRTMTRTQHHLTCQHCERPFEAQKAEARFCSLKCYGDSMRIRTEERDRKAEILGKNYAAMVNGKPVLLEHPSLMRCLESSSNLVYDEWDGQTVIVGCR